MPSPEQLQEWNIIFTRIERMEDFQKLKKHLDSVYKQIEQLDEGLKYFKSPRNPREDMIQVHERNKFQMLKKQKDRLELKLNELGKQIEIDIKIEK